MRILLCHNYYQVPGGEDRCYEDEGRLLEQHGHHVVRYQRNNDGIRGWASLATAPRTLWNPRTYREIRQIVRRERIDVIHCTNAFPLISPSLYYAASREGVPVVQSLQNYRLFCANAYFLRQGRVCESCTQHRIPWPAVRHGCYRDSRAGSAVVAAMQTVHHRLGSWHRRVQRFIVPSQFALDKFVDLGLPADRIRVKPNFVDPAPEPGDGRGDYALFAGRVSPEKGIATLVEAWQDPRCTLRLKIVGDGPQSELAQAAAERNPRIEYLGRKTPAEVLRVMASARFLVVPSLWYEGLPRTIVESLAVGTPVIAADIGSLTEMARAEAGGETFPAGDAAALATVAARMCQDAELARSRRVLARAEFERHYAAKPNYELLVAIYRQAMEMRTHL